MKLTTGGDERAGTGTIQRPLRRLEHARPGGGAIHVFPGNTRQHHAKALKPFLERPDCRASGPRVSRRPTRRT